MAAEHEIEELQLQLESKVCGLGVDALAELAEHLQVETKEFRRLALSMKIREKIEQDVSEADDKKTLLVGLTALWMENHLRLKMTQQELNRRK